MTKEEVLQNCTVEGLVVKLPAEQLDIEKGAFKESGTMVGGKIVIINKTV